MHDPIRHFHKPPTKRQHKKVSKYLSSGEDPVVVTSIGNRYFWLTVIFLLVIPLGFMYLSIFMFAGLVNIPNYDWLKYVGLVFALFLILTVKRSSGVLRKKQSFLYILTNHRCLIVSGIFNRKIITAPLDRITHITVMQSFPQRLIFNTGHLLIITAGFDQKEIVIENVENPVKFKVLIEELSRKSERGDEIKKEEKTTDSAEELRAISA